MPPGSSAISPPSPRRGGESDGRCGRSGRGRAVDHIPGRLTGRPGVCIATLGPGALNFSTGAAYAHLGAMPMILITGQKAIMTARQARFQIVDVIASMRPLTKMTRQIVSAPSIPAIVREAFRVAMEERPGPVHLELPEDVAGEAGEPVAMSPPHPGAIPVAPT